MFCFLQISVKDNKVNELIPSYIKSLHVEAFYIAFAPDIKDNLLAFYFLMGGVACVWL